MFLLKSWAETPLALFVLTLVVSDRERKHVVENGVAAMTVEGTTGNRVLEEVVKTPGCLLEDVIRACPDLSWNQVLLEVDRLSRTGRIALKLEGAGCYRIWSNKDTVKQRGGIGGKNEHNTRKGETDDGRPIRALWPSDDARPTACIDRGESHTEPYGMVLQRVWDNRRSTHDGYPPQVAQGD